MLSSVHAVCGRTLPLRLAVTALFLVVFQKFVHSPQSPTFVSLDQEDQIKFWKLSTSGSSLDHSSGKFTGLS